MQDIITALNWRYATKKFDNNKKLSFQQVEQIKEILRLTPSSFGLQPWKFVIIEDQKIQDALVKHSWWQTQISEASHVIVLCRRNNIDENLVQEYINSMIQTTEASAKDLEGYKNMILGFLQNKTLEQIEVWSNKQIYIALGNIITALAIAKIDSCPMEWFFAEKYDEILKLWEKELSSVVVLPVGYRAKDDHHAQRQKVRFDTKQLFVDM